MFLVILTLAAIVFALAMALSWVNARYDDLIGKPRPERQEYPWLRSLSAEREQWIKRDRGVTGVERAVVLSVVAAVLGFEIWFFFFAKYTFAGG